MKNLLLIAVAVLLFTACEKDDDLRDTFSDADLLITSGYACGWGAGTDSLIISSEHFDYRFGASFPEEQRIEKQGDVTAEDWHELIKKLDFGTFSSIDIHTCYLCVDGCDYWITVRRGDDTHTIRYGYTDEDLAVVEPVADFIDELEELKAKLLAD